MPSLIRLALFFFIYLVHNVDVETTLKQDSESGTMGSDQMIATKTAPIGMKTLEVCVCGGGGAGGRAPACLRVCVRAGGRAGGRAGVRVIFYCLPAIKPSTPVTLNKFILIFIKKTK